MSEEDHGSKGSSLHSNLQDPQLRLAILCVSLSSIALTDLVTDIITVMTWYQWCEEGKLDCHWWVIRTTFVLLPICIRFVSSAIDLYQIKVKQIITYNYRNRDFTMGASLLYLLLPFSHSIWHIFISIYADCTNHKNMLLEDMLNNARFINVIFEDIPQATIQWFLILTHGELYHGTGTFLGRKYDIFWVAITSAIISTIRYGQICNFSVNINLIIDIAQNVISDGQ